MALFDVKFAFPKSHWYTISIIDSYIFQRCHVFVVKQQSVQNWIMWMQFRINLSLLRLLLEYWVFWWKSDLNGYFSIYSWSLMSLACIWMVYPKTQKKLLAQGVVHCNFEWKEWLKSARMDKQNRKKMKETCFFVCISLVLACYL